MRHGSAKTAWPASPTLALKSHSGVRCMLSSMRHLELHVLETETDIDLAIQAGLLNGEQLASAECAECGELVGHDSSGFIGFAVVIDETDTDWTLCLECVAPVVDSPLQYNATSFKLDDLSETFDEDDLEQF